MTSINKLTNEVDKLEAQLREKKKALAEEQEKLRNERQNTLQDFVTDLLATVLDRKLEKRQEDVPETRNWVHEGQPTEYAFCGSDSETQGVYLYGIYDRKGTENYCSFNDDSAEKLVVAVTLDPWEVKELITKHKLY